jgi:hypothetical protein
MRHPTHFATLFLCILALAADASAAGPDVKPSPVAAEQFESLKKLAGDWVESGKASGPVVASYRVTAAGSAVEETLAPGTDHEMITMYHLDGGDLVMTHYCTLGNQPHMKAEPNGDAKRMVFKFVGGTNLASENAMHMRQAAITVLGTDHFKSEWTACKDGEDCHKANFDLVRKQKD